MKITLFFLLCFVSATWQHNIYWSYPPRRVPLYSMFDKNFQDNLPILIPSDPTELQYSKRYGYRHLEQDDVEQPTLAERSLGISNIYHRMKTNLEPKTFGFNNYLASLILNSLTVSTTITSVTTSTSVITAATVVTCFLDAMFEMKTACRRKRDAFSSLLIGDSDHEYLNIPFSSETAATGAGAFELPEEGRDADPAQIITSSQNEEEVHVHESVLKQTESSVDRYIRAKIEISLIPSRLLRL
ncbi:uncharacterized protein LOC124198837 isoform X2 [Daphnia pulex]|uniref:uncharacterized protein LOC124198837 isoform X2 n=1 Tax=Daphnia pulex TaxID=6669 RepID=UPI001EDF625E|nr:uncharacterized protein LOC124198837 isoform X2 [Daphnia pulex]